MGLHLRGHRPRHEFYTYRRTTEYLCWHYGNAHFPNASPNPGIHGRRRRERALGNGIWARAEGGRRKQDD